MAITCGQDGFLTSETCGAGSECRTYELQEHRFNADPDDPQWLVARTVQWAGCVQEGALECDMAWNGNYYAPTTPPACDDKDQITCRSFPAPSLFSNFPQLQYGSEIGWQSIIPCEADERCAGSNTLNEFTCIDVATPDCDGSEPRCQGTGAVVCAGTWESLPGYQVVVPCGGGDVCYEGTNGPLCRAPGEVACDEQTFAPLCDGDSVATCYEGFTHHQSCATCSWNGVSGPCRCDDYQGSAGYSWNGVELTCHEASYPVCIADSLVDCDPDTQPDECNGAVARRCLGHWDEHDCAAFGMVCGVADGIAGCRAPTAPTCNQGGLPTCDGTEVVACCKCGSGDFLFSPALPAPCVGGFEARSDCADLGPNYTCEASQFGFAECVFNP